MKVLLGICGSSGVNLGLKLLENLQEQEVFCIITKGAKLSFQAEKHLDLDVFCKEKFQKINFLDNNNLAAGVASGSFGIEKTILAPCSVSTLAKIHAGFGDTLLTRACCVALKERKTLILAVREMPFSTLSLEHMVKLSSLGAIVAPPVYASYAKSKTLEELENFIIGKWLDLLGIKHHLFQRWKH